MTIYIGIGNFIFYNDTFTLQIHLNCTRFLVENNVMQFNQSQLSSAIKNRKIELSFIGVIDIDVPKIYNSIAVSQQQ